MHELDVNCAMPKSRVCCAFAQTGHQRRRGRIPPYKYQRPPITIDASLGERQFMAEIEQAVVHPPLRGLHGDISHLANFRRQSNIEPPSLDHNTACHGDQHHARAKTGYLKRAWTARSKRGFDKPIGKPGQHCAQQDNQFALRKRQGPEFDDSEKYQQRPVPQIERVTDQPDPD
jgi:hypothetical protein